MSEPDTTSKVALTLILRLVAKSPPEAMLLYRTRNRKLAPENDIRYKFLSGISSLVPLAVRAMRKIIG